MELFAARDREFAEHVGQLGHSNPFLPERIEIEQQCLGKEFDARGADWNIRAGDEPEHPNVERIIARSQRLLETTRERLLNRDQPVTISANDVARYEDLLLFVLYHDHRPEMDDLVAIAAAGSAARSPTKLFCKLSARADHYLQRHTQLEPIRALVPHFFAGFVQIRRAFRNIFSFIVGRSKASVRLRANVWQSIFTHDMRRYRRVLFHRMADYSTLITGPSGSGKELVAQAIGCSQYIAFDPKSNAFVEDVAGSFSPISLAAMSPTLIESELFGHAKGAFTGAIAERRGWLESCPATGAVFLDEIGELEPAIQVKLLRVLQSREFTRLGETSHRRFAGKIIAATNRDLTREMVAGRFREDLYYRLCSDRVAAPSLRERFDDDPAELHELVLHIATRLIGDEAANVAAETEMVIRRELGDHYPWPGNVRELEQCVRNVLIRRSYAAARPDAANIANPSEQLLAAMQTGSLTADELIRHYCKLVYQQTGSYEATARKLALDRRTVKAKVMETSV